MFHVSGGIPGKPFENFSLESTCVIYHLTPLHARNLNFYVSEGSLENPSNFSGNYMCNILFDTPLCKESEFSCVGRILGKPFEIFSRKYMCKISYDTPSRKESEFLCVAGILGKPFEIYSLEVHQIYFQNFFVFLYIYELMLLMDSYCVYCRMQTKSLHPAYITTANGKLQQQSNCQVCGKKKSMFLKQGSGVFNTLLNKLPLPEMHLRLPKDVRTEQVPGGDFNNTGTYSFCGPFTKLEKRLQQGYKGVNNLDRACMRHDIAYSQNSDTKNRNVADDILAKDAIDIANNVNDPAYERQQARSVAAIMATKSRFGLGSKSKKKVRFLTPWQKNYIEVSDESL